MLLLLTTVPAGGTGATTSTVPVIPKPDTETLPGPGVTVILWRTLLRRAYAEPGLPGRTPASQSEQAPRIIRPGQLRRYCALPYPHGPLRRTKAPARCRHEEVRRFKGSLGMSHPCRARSPGEAVSLTSAGSASYASPNRAKSFLRQNRVCSSWRQRVGDSPQLRKEPDMPGVP